MLTTLSNASPRSWGADRAARGAPEPVRPSGGRLSLLMARMHHAWHRDGRTGATFEHVDGSVLAVDDFHASHSLGLDGAPSMVFNDTMPPYSRDLDRPAPPPVALVECQP